MFYLKKNLQQQVFFADNEAVDEWTTPMFNGEGYITFTDPAVTARCVINQLGLTSI